MVARRLRAAFLGSVATGVLDRLAKTREGDLRNEHGRWLFRASRPSPLASGEWSRGVDVVVLGAVVGAPLPGVNSVRAPPRQALLHAAAAGVPRIVIVARDDADELAHRAMCTDLGLEGDEAIVVRTDQIADVAEVVDAMDRVAVAPPPGAVIGAVVARAFGREVDVFGTVLRGALAANARVHVLAGDEWIPCAVAQVTRRQRDGYVSGEPLAMADAGDRVSLFLRAQRDVSALNATLARSDRLMETLVVDEPLPLVGAVAKSDSLEPIVDVSTRELRVFLGWNVATARAEEQTLQFSSLQPAPPTGRYFVLP